MDKNEVRRRVFAQIAAVFNVDEKTIVPAWSLREDLGADSVSLIELLVGLEETFETEVPDMWQVEIESIGDIIDFIHQHLSSESSDGRRLASAAPEG